MRSISGSRHLLTDRFGGTVERLATVDVAGLSAWVSAIDLATWPQQDRVGVRPAMVTDLAWYGFGEQIAPIMERLLPLFPGCVATQQMLSVVMPGREIEPHVDHQPPHWLCRVHVPLTSNPGSAFTVGGVDHVLEPGTAYRVNTEALHSVTNRGATPRIHFMFDVRTSDGAAAARRR